MELDSSAASWTLQGIALLSFAVASLLAAAVSTALYLRLRRQGSALSAKLEAVSSQLDALTVHDGVTGLLSRAEFDAALDRAAARCDRDASAFCVLYVDLDNFRPVNDAFGHEQGDQVLREVARRLLACAGGDTAASRIAADEFAFIVRGDLAQGHAAAARLALACEQPFTLRSQAVRLSCSIGIAAYPIHGSRPKMLDHAALAMRSVKLAGGAAHGAYDPQIGVGLREQAVMLHDLKLALELGQFELLYQPKVDAKSLQITAAEALLRWRHPQRGVVSPTVFIPLAERHGLIGSIGNWVIDEACRQAAVWRDRGLRMRVAVNISGYQMRQDDFVERIEAALARNHIPPRRFTCEITETVAMENTRATHRAFEKLGELGVHVSIDDFGTGHSSLASLRRLPAAELKIDRAFVCDLESSDDARSIALAIVQMAHTLDLHVVAEGIETAQQRDLLVAMGCDELQGYLFARPMSADALELWATDERDMSDGDFRPSLFVETRAADL
jgi:diguanylate cyclase (GGDEF)-like protein